MVLAMAELGLEEEEEEEEQGTLIYVSCFIFF